MGLKSTILKI